MWYNEILRKMFFVQNLANCCYFAQKFQATEAKFCILFRKTCANVLQTKTLTVLTHLHDVPSKLQDTVCQALLDITYVDNGWR